jgi:hypothetical protein
VLFITGLETLRTTAMALPDEETRASVHETVKNLLPDLLIPVKDNFNDLKGYIRDGWPGEDPKPRYEAAGLLKYNAIGTANWESVSGLNEKMNLFIADVANNTALTTGGMPATFAMKVTTDGTNFDTKYQLFMTSRETTTARNAKVKANNNLYSAIMEVCEDGKGMIYRTDEAGRKRYTYDVVKKLVSPPGAASLKIMAKHTDDTLVMNGDVTIKLAGQPPKTGQILNGVCSFSNVEKGKYNGTITISGNPAATFEKEVEVGTNARVTVVVS